MINFRSNSIILLGDTHDLRRTLHIIQRKENLDGQDIVFLGDGGEGFFEPQTDAVYLQKISDAAKKRDIRLFVIRGNHSNPDVWKRGYQFDNLFLVQDYTEAIFPNKKTALLVGGGISIDRPYRTLGFDYWDDEITPYVKQNKSFDIFFAHDAPDYFNHSTQSLWTSPYQKCLLDDADLFEDALDQRLVINQIVSDIHNGTLLFCFSGHFHNSFTGEKGNIFYRCLDIEELLELNT